MKPRRRHPVRALGAVVLVAAGAFLATRDDLPGFKDTSGPSPGPDAIPAGTAPARPSTLARALVEPVLEPRDDNPGQGNDLAAPNPLAPAVVDALTGLAREPDQAARSAMVGEFVRRLPPAAFPAALAVLADPALAESGRELRVDLLRGWSEQNWMGATHWVRRLSPGVLREESITTLARSAVRQLPPDDTREWVQEWTSPVDRLAALPALVQELAQVDPVAALTWVAESPELAGHDDLIAEVAWQWAASNPAEAFAWAGEVTDPDLQPRLLAGIVVTWADRDPAAAAAAAVHALPPGREQDDAVVSIVQRWTQQDPRSASAWVAAFPEGELRDTAGRELVRLWAEQDAEQAGNWLNAVEPGALRDAGIAAYVEVLLPQAPDAAAAWVGAIEDPVRRMEAQEQTGLLWLELDAAGARAWIDATAFPDAVRRRLLAAGGD